MGRIWRAITWTLWEAADMDKLMRAHLFRMKRDRVFWICMAVMLACSVGMTLNGCRQAGIMIAQGYQWGLEKYYFTLGPMVGFLAGTFSGLFLGTEHADGAVRGKLIVGYPRRQVYLSALLVNMLAAGAITAVWLAGGLVGIPFLGLWKQGAAAAAVQILIAFGSAMALASIFTLLGMMVEKKSAGAVGSIVLFMALLLVAAWGYNALMEPEMTAGFIMTVDGVQTAELTPNPNYVSGVMRRALELILDILPTGQEALLSNGGIVRPGLNLAASAVITLCTTLAGLAFFEGKDLK